MHVARAEAKAKALGMKMENPNIDNASMVECRGMITEISG